MQDIYAFDVGDFGKIGLLRLLCSSTRLPLGVLWWKTSCGSRGLDGKHVKYLEDRWFRRSDPQLWEAMRQKLASGDRTITRLQTLFPIGTLFDDVPVPVRSDRPAWFGRAMNVIRDVPLVFCDPDNGVTFDGSCDSVQHIGCHEVEALFRARHSLVIYHHLGRSSSHEAQIKSGLERFCRALPEPAVAWGARFKRGSSRVFFVLAQHSHADRVGDALDGMRASRWCRDGHFEIIQLSETLDRQTAPSRLRVEARNMKTIVPNRGRPTSHPQAAAAASKVRVVLNDNGGLNLVANQWLRRIDVPCRLVTEGGQEFSVVGLFRDRDDMYRTSPSPLKLARHHGFEAKHLSKLMTVAFEAHLIDTAPAPNEPLNLSDDRMEGTSDASERASIGGAVDWRNRISADPNVLVGKPVIKGTRISVELVMDLLAAGYTAEQVRRQYDHITLEDIQACLAYAGEVIRSERMFAVKG